MEGCRSRRGRRKEETGKSDEMEEGGDEEVVKERAESKKRDAVDVCEKEWEWG